MKYICALITVSNIEKSKAFYTNILHQKIAMDHGENVFFEGGFAIHLDTHFKQLTNRVIQNKSNNFELYFEDDNVEEIVKKLKNQGIEFVHQIQEQPWKQKVVRFYDLDGHIIEIGETMENVCKRLSDQEMPISEIAKNTGMPLAFISKVLKKK